MCGSYWVCENLCAKLRLADPENWMEHHLCSGNCYSVVGPG